MYIKQTINAVDMGGGGGLQALRQVPGPKLAIILDSKYLIMGAQGKV